MIYRHRRISAAAAEMGVTQSAVSLMLKELETLFGVRLFDRTTRALTPTSAADYALSIAQRIAADTRALEHNISQLTAAKTGRVVFGVSPAIASAVMPNVLAKFRRHSPLIQVEMHDMSLEKLLANVLTGEIEFGIGNIEEAHPDLVTQVMMKGQLCAVVHKLSPLAKRKYLRWNELGDIPVIAMRKGTEIRAQIDRILKQHKTSFSPIHEVSLFSTSFAFTSQRLGVSILPIYLVDFENSPLIALPLVRPVVYREMTFVQRANRSLSPAVALFRLEMETHFQDVFSKRRHTVVIK